jgi:hypothetical protein
MTASGTMRQSIPAAESAELFHRLNRVVPAGGVVTDHKGFRGAANDERDGLSVARRGPAVLGVFSTIARRSRASVNSGPKLAIFLSVCGKGGVCPYH